MKNDQQSNELLKHVNSSGFPFQQAVAECINQSTSSHGWKVDVIEHRWRHPVLTRSGFIDIIASHKVKTISLIVECKRLKDSALIFLTSKSLNEEMRSLSSFVVSRNVGSPFGENSEAVRSSFWWDLVCKSPTSFSSMFCSFKGQDERNPMLERISDDILPATESVAIEYVQANKRVHSGERCRLFMPIIVTNSKLFRCSFDASDISLSNGEIPDEAGTIDEVPYIVFKKSLASHYDSFDRFNLNKNKSFVDVESISQSNERSILLINSEHLTDAIRHIDFTPDSPIWQFSSHFSNASKTASLYNQEI